MNNLSISEQRNHAFSILKGRFIHVPDAMIGSSLDEVRKNELLDCNFDFADLPYAVSLPEYSIPKTYGGARGGGKSYGLKPEDKLEFICSQLITDLKTKPHVDTLSLYGLIDQFLVENPVENPVTQLYFDRVRAVTGKPWLLKPGNL